MHAMTGRLLLKGENITLIEALKWINFTRILFANTLYKDIQCFFFFKKKRSPVTYSRMLFLDSEGSRLMAWALVS